MTASELQPSRWLMTARLCASLNDENQRKRASERAESYLLGKIEENPFDHFARIGLAQVLVDDQRIEEAVASIAQGLKIAGNDRSPPVMALRRAASDLLVLRIDSVPDDADLSLETKFNWVFKAIELDSNNAKAYGKMLELYQAVGSADYGKSMTRMLEKQIAQGNSIAMAHFALGTSKWLDGQLDDALWHTERALELEPKLLDVANNFAWLLSEDETPNLDRALALIESALAKRPNDHRYRDTKGTILMKLKRWNDALTEFESILPLVRQGNREPVHQKLAEIYSALGRTELAELHRAESLRIAKPEK